LRDAAAAEWQWSMCNSAIREFSDSHHLKRSAAVVTGQPGDLRADRYAIDHRRNSNSSNRDVKHERRFSLQLW
jgi:hypothetical protein